MQNESEASAARKGERSDQLRGGKAEHATYLVWPGRLEARRGEARSLGIVRDFRVGLFDHFLVWSKRAQQKRHPRGRN